MQHEVTRHQRLLDRRGFVQEPGFARSLVWDYNRENIHAPKFRIKEWDYYLVANEDFGVAFTISDLGYLGLISVSFLNLKEKWEKTIMRCDSDSGKKLIKSMVLRTADRQGMC